MKSPALEYQSDIYPASWHGKVPKRVRMAMTIHPDMPFLAPPLTVAENGKEYDCWVNSHGAVAVICENGFKLGVKPYEFEITGWHETGPVGGGE